MREKDSSVEVVFFQEADNTAPFDAWLGTIPSKALAKCRVRLGRLEELGHQLRRPEAEYLGDDIYELRVKHDGVNYRMLYFFHGRKAVVVTHGFTKQQAKVPASEIKVALRLRETFLTNPARYTFYPPPH